MPQSDTWPSSVAVASVTVETQGGMDGAGGCDGVVSAHSGSSYASLEQLSAEEQECILFLEEMIEALEADVDSDPTSTETERQLTPGGRPEKIAHLSASLSDSISKHLHDGPKGEVDRVHRPVQGYLVPTPLVMAKSSQPNSEPGTGSPPTVSSCTRSAKKGSSRGQDATAAGKKTGCQDRPRSGSSRGPLSYEGLLELRVKTSLRKHAQSFCSGVREGATESPTDLSKGSQSSRSTDSLSQNAPLHQTPKLKITPPIVAPKPKIVPPSIAVTTQKVPVPKPESVTNCLGTPPRERVIMDPQQVRREALCKLGLLQDGGTTPPPVAQTLQPAMSHPRSRSDLPIIPGTCPPPPPVGVTVEGSGVSLDQAVHMSKPRPCARTASPGHGKELAPQPDTTAEPTSQKSLFPNGISVAMAPWNQSGQVRQEALRKLGLLRE